MASITLKEGDFGADVTITVGSEDLYLPDPNRPGLNMIVPLADVTEIEAVENDRSGQFQYAFDLAADGFRQHGPAGLIMGMYAATRAKDVVFKVSLKDGKHFVAVADAKTFADLHSAQISARSAALMGDAPSPADDIIAKYLKARQPQPMEAAPVPSPPPVPSRPPMVAMPSPAPAPDSDDEIERSAPRPAFGRRRRP